MIRAGHTTKLGFLLLPFFCLATGGSSAAQEAELDDFRTGAFVQMDERPVSSVKTGCPSFPTNSCDYRSPVIKSACDVVSFDSLGVVQDRLFSLATYRRSTTFGADAAETSDEQWACETDEILLIEMLPDDFAKPVWYGTAERTYEFITSASIANSAKADIFSVTYCLNGTGGCEQRLYIWHAAKLHALERDSTWEKVYAQLPAKYRPHKSPPMDLVNLTWEQHVAGPYDANCCPSGRLLLDLDVVDGRLSVESARLEVELDLDHD